MAKQSTQATNDSENERQVSSTNNETDKSIHPKRKHFTMGNAVLLSEEYDDALVGRAWPLENPWLGEMVAVYDLDKAYEIYFRNAKAVLKAEDPELTRDELTTIAASEWSVELDFAFRGTGNRRPIFVQKIGRASRNAKEQ